MPTRRETSPACLRGTSHDTGTPTRNHRSRFVANERRQLAELLCEKSLSRGDFTLSSGKKTDIYVDAKKTVLTGRGATLAGRQLWELVSGLSGDIRGVGGLTLGADPLVTAIAMTAYGNGREIDAIIVRKGSKEHGTKQLLEMPDGIEPGDEVVAVDDVVTTAGSIIDAIERMRDFGLAVDHATCLVDREDVGARALADIDVELHPVFTLSELREIRGQE